MKKIDSKDSFLWAAARRRDFADVPKNALSAA